MTSVPLKASLWLHGHAHAHMGFSYYLFWNIKGFGTGREGGGKSLNCNHDLTLLKLLRDLFF
jgi:hypothetical protein